MIRFFLRSCLALRSLLVLLVSGKRISFHPMKVILENGVNLVATGDGRIRFEGKLHCKRFSDIECHGGQVRIGQRAFLNKSFTLVCRESVIIGDDCQFGNNVSIYDHDHRTDEIPFPRDGYVSRPIQLGNNVWVGCNAFIGKGVTIGNNVVIAANAVVTKDVPDNTVYYGVKCR